MPNNITHRPSDGTIIYRNEASAMLISEVNSSSGRASHAEVGDHISPETPLTPDEAQIETLYLIGRSWFVGTRPMNDDTPTRFASRLIDDLKKRIDYITVAIEEVERLVEEFEKTHGETKHAEQE